MKLNVKNENKTDSLSNKDTRQKIKNRKEIASNRSNARNTGSAANKPTAYFPPRTPALDSVQ